MAWPRKGQANDRSAGAVMPANSHPPMQHAMHAQSAVQSGATLEADFVVVGAGPAGQKAAVQAAKAGKRVVLIERESAIGGECVHRGTIPSKTLRQRAVEKNLHGRPGDRTEASLPALLGEVRQVISAHTQYMLAQLQRNSIHVAHGQAVFLDANTLRIDQVGGGSYTVCGKHILLATGSVPRRPEDVPVDHEHILDSDSILSMAYLPQSLIVLGGGVIACEYASIFSLLGVRVTMIDRNERPLMFMDAELAEHFVDSLRRRGSEFIGNAGASNVEWDEVAAVHVTLQDGRELSADKVLCALGRVARLDGLGRIVWRADDCTGFGYFGSPCASAELPDGRILVSDGTNAQLVVMDAMTGLTVRKSERRSG